MSAGVNAIDATETRGRIAEAGRGSVGLGSTGAAERQVAYEEWLFPHPDDDKFQAAMADAMYSCGLNARSCLRASGVDDPRLGAPYHRSMGAVVSWLESVAREMGAFVPLARASDVAARVTADSCGLDVGDVLVVDGPVHVIVLTDKVDGWAFVTSEGGCPEVGTRKDGRGVERGMGIKSRTMALRLAGGRLQTGTRAADGSVTWGRFALYAIDAGRLRRTDESGMPGGVGELLTTSDAHVSVVTPDDVAAALAKLGYADVRAFQRAWGRGLAVDGIAGRMTRAALEAALVA